MSYVSYMSYVSFMRYIFSCNHMSYLEDKNFFAIFNDESFETSKI